jgi:hypothetical protein
MVKILYPAIEKQGIRTKNFAFMKRWFIHFVEHYKFMNINIFKAFPNLTQPDL